MGAGGAKVGAASALALESPKTDSNEAVTMVRNDRIGAPLSLLRQLVNRSHQAFIRPSVCG
jgi:hypothetical protein